MIFVISGEAGIRAKENARSPSFVQSLTTSAGGRCRQLAGKMQHQSVAAAESAATRSRSSVSPR